MTIKKTTVWAIVIIYKPDTEKLSKLYLSLKDQVDKTVFVCNSEFDSTNFECTIIKTGANIGIAAAQNIGSKLALQHCVDFILYSDQDTEYPKEYVTDILSYYDLLTVQGHNIAAVGPAFRDVNKGNNIQPMVYFKNGRLKKSFFGAEPFNSSHIISSGMVVPSTALSVIGLNREDFFIDWVDTEWCWRAYELGYKVYQVPSIIIEHSIGDSSLLLFGKNITVHKPMRSYYKIRNIIYLLLHVRYTRLPVSYYALTVSVKIFILNVYAAEFKLQAIRLGFRAIKDGILGRLGSRKFD